MNSRLSLGLNPNPIEKGGFFDVHSIKDPVHDDLFIA